MRKAFTLLEVLVSIAILSILAAITFSIVGGVRAKAAQSVCASNLGQLTKASMLYADVNDGRLAVWDGDTGWIDKLMPPREGALICPVAGPLKEVPLPDPISDHGGYTQNSCLIGTTANVRDPSLSVMYAEAVRAKDPNSTVGIYQIISMSGPDVYYVASFPIGDVNTRLQPLGEFGALRHSGGGLYAFVDGHVKWLVPTAFRLPEHGCGCAEYMPLLKVKWKWIGPADGPYFSPEPGR